jgi:hypothetical protein
MLTEKYRKEAPIMPKVKSYKTRSPAQKVLDVMAYHRSRLCLSPKEWAERIAIPPATLWRREKTPEAFTLGELTRIAKACDVPLEDLISGRITQERKVS